MKSQPLLFLYGNPFLSPQLLFLIFSFPFSFSYARAWRHTHHTHAVKRERGRANTGVQYSESHLTVVIEIHGRIYFQILNSIFTAWDTFLTEYKLTSQQINIIYLPNTFVVTLIRFVYYKLYKP